MVNFEKGSGKTFSNFTFLYYFIFILVFLVVLFFVIFFVFCFVFFNYQKKNFIQGIFYWKKDKKRPALKLILTLKINKQEVVFLVV